MSTKERTKVADVCIVVEATYPYVSGGVSSWIHMLVSNLPELTFCIVHLGGKPQPEHAPVYTLPDNVIDMRYIYLFDTSWIKRYHSPRASARSKQSWEQIRHFHDGLKQGQAEGVADLFTWLGHASDRGVTPADLCFSPQSWELLTTLYDQQAADESFADYNWTFRSTHLPLFSLLRAQLPVARVYHAVSSGFNGFVSGVAKLRTNAPFIVTEHGLSTREREMEIVQSDWIYQGGESQAEVLQRFSHFQAWWLNMFRFMARVTYDCADHIITIAGFNQRYQLRDGADPRKMRLIPNGINVERYQPDPAAPPPERELGQFVIALVGRVVPIKDIKTYIRAAHLVRQQVPNLKAYIVGPQDEDPDYAMECQHLVEMLGLEGIVEFTGPADVREYYRKIDVLVMTSISEGQPLVILEGNCGGVPVVATDVGGCRELLVGLSADDVALGPSGLVTAPVSPQETAEALLRLWQNADLRKTMARAGFERARRFYHADLLYDAYRTLYRELLQVSPVSQERS